MLAVTLALISSFLTGATTILMKKTIERSNPTSAMLMITLVGSIVLLFISWFTVPVYHLNSASTIYFIVAGIFSPALVRWLYFISLDRIGPSVSSSILATGPAFTAVMALAFLKEEITLQIGLGIIIVIAGIVIFERDMNNKKIGKRNRKNLAFPLLAAFLFSCAVVARKMGLNILNSPILGVTVGFVTSLVIYAGMCLVSKKLRASISIEKKDLPYFFGSGIFLTAAWLVMFYALSIGDAIIVTPLANLHPLVVLALSYFFLGDIDKITKGILLGVGVVAAGVLLITTGQA